MDTNQPHSHWTPGFLACYRATGQNERYLHRARLFALAAEEPRFAGAVGGCNEPTPKAKVFHPSQAHKFNQHTGQQGTPHHPWSLFEGLGGLLALYTDLVLNPHPTSARFPAVAMGAAAGVGGVGVGV